MKNLKILLIDNGINSIKIINWAFSITGINYNILNTILYSSCYYQKIHYFSFRYYLRREFPELVSVSEESRKNNKYVLTELGCGVGDTIFPLKIEYQNLNLQGIFYRYFWLS